MKTDPIIDYARQCHAAAVAQCYEDEPPRSLPKRDDINEQTKREDLDADSIVERRRIARAHGRGVNE